MPGQGSQDELFTYAAPLQPRARGWPSHDLGLVKENRLYAILGKEGGFLLQDNM
jgi:hypothetical protein